MGLQMLLRLLSSSSSSASPMAIGLSLHLSLSRRLWAFRPSEPPTWSRGGCGEASDVLVEMGAHLRFDPRRIVYQRPRDARDAVSLPPACDVERRFWGRPVMGWDGGRGGGRPRCLRRHPMSRRGVGEAQRWQRRA